MRAQDHSCHLSLPLSYYSTGALPLTGAKKGYIISSVGYYFMGDDRGPTASRPSPGRRHLSQTCISQGGTNQKSWLSGLKLSWLYKPLISVKRWQRQKTMFNLLKREIKGCGMLIILWKIGLFTKYSSKQWQVRINPEPESKEEFLNILVELK